MIEHDWPWKCWLADDGTWSLGRWIRGEEYEPIAVGFATLEAAESAMQSELSETQDLAFPLIRAQDLCVDDCDLTSSVRAP